MNTITYTPVVHNGEKRILVIFEKDAKIIAELRKKTDAKWSKTHKAWHIEDTTANRLKCKLPIEESNIAQQEKTVKVPVKQATSTLPTIFLLVQIVPTNEERIAIPTTNKFLEKVIKQVKGVKWDAEKKHWHIPCTKLHYDALLVLTKNIAIVNNKQLLKYLNDKKNTTTPLAQKQPKQNANAVTTNISLHNRKLLTKAIELLQIKAYSTSTIRTYTNEIAIFLQTIKIKNADELLTEDVRRYIHYCIEKLCLSENTVHSRLNALKFFYEQMLGHKKFFVSIPRPKKHLQLPKVLGEQELRRLFNAPTNLKHKAILFVAYSAGLRVSEVINLRLQDIDRERQQLFIYCSKGKKDRYVMLSPMVLDVLEQYYKMSETKPTYYLFEGYEKGQPYSIRSAQKIFSEAKSKAGIIKTVTFHSLRHSFATHLLEKGIDVIFIKDLLGHFDIKTTERYLHVRRDLLINISSPIDGLYKKQD
jgi:integrase/recombinase XerD